MEIEAAKRATKSDWSKYPDISPEEVEQLVSEHYEYKLLKVEALAEKWCNTQPSPYADAYSDLPISVRITREHGQELKAILSKELRRPE